MKISEALEALENGSSINRKTWPQGQTLSMSQPKQGEEAVIEMTTADSKISDWTPQQADLTAEDWEVSASAGMTFEEAITAAKSGGTVTRKGWGGASNLVKDQKLKRLVQIAPNGQKSGDWKPDQLDMLTDDWLIVN